MMPSEQIETTEHFALFANIELKEFCKRFISVLGLPQMEFDYENETEWCDVKHNGIEYNVSRPYKKGTLHEWDSSVPESCNFGICLMFEKGIFTEKIKSEIIQKIGITLAKEFNVNIVYHRTWYGVLEKDTLRTVIFEPK